MKLRSIFTAAYWKAAQVWRFGVAVPKSSSVSRTPSAESSSCSRCSLGSAIAAVVHFELDRRGLQTVADPAPASAFRPAPDRALLRRKIHCDAWRSRPWAFIVLSARRRYHDPAAQIYDETGFLRGWN